jgi:hypothetical protein
MATIARRPEAQQQLRQRKGVAESSASGASKLEQQQQQPSPEDFEVVEPGSGSEEEAKQQQQGQQYATSVQFTPYPQLDSHHFALEAHSPSSQHPHAGVSADADEELVFPGGFKASAPSFSEPLRYEQYPLANMNSLASSSVSPDVEVQEVQMMERRPLLAVSQPQQQQQPASSQTVVQTQSGPRPLSPASLARLEQLRAKARLAEAQADALEAAIKRGQVAPPPPEPVRIVQHRVQLGDDLTNLAVHYGSSVSAIRAANSRILVFEQSIDNAAGQLIDIPATQRWRPPVSNAGPVDAAEAERLRKRALTRKFLQGVNASGRLCDAQEAEFYLDDAGWDVATALAQWRDDSEWETTNGDMEAEQKKQKKQLGASSSSSGSAAAGASSRAGKGGGGAASGFGPSKLF